MSRLPSAVFGKKLWFYGVLYTGLVRKEFFIKFMRFFWI